MKKTVLLYNFAPDEQAAAKRALLPLHFAVRVISEDEMPMSVGYLAGLTEDSGKREYEGGRFGMLVVMGGFLGSDVDKLLSAMRKAGFGRDVLKAVINGHDRRYKKKNQGALQRRCKSCKIYPQP